MPVTYSVQVLQRNINRLYLPRGEGYRWHDRVVRQMFVACVAAAPMRSGELKGKHRITGKMSNGAYVRAEITNFADHAENVHEGYPRGATTSIPGAIRAKSKKGMSVPRRGRSGRFRTQAVAGQAKNPWLEDACTRVAVIHGGVVIG